MSEIVSETSSEIIIDSEKTKSKNESESDAFLNQASLDYLINTKQYKIQLTSALNTKINTSSGDLKTYINNVSGVLNAQIINDSTSGYANAIASGTDFQFSGAKKFVSPISVPRINLSGASAPSEIAIVASSGQVSIVGSAGTFMSFVESGVGSSVNSLWAATDVAGIPVIEIFDDYTVVFGRSSSKAIIMSGISGYLIMPNLPNETQISSLPASTIYKSGGYIRIK